MSTLNDVKAGKYQLVAQSWERITSKPGEPLDFTRYKRGDVVDLNVEDAKRLVAAGAVVEPGALERSAVERAKAAAEEAQRQYDAVLSGLPEEVRAEFAPETVASTGQSADALDINGDVKAILGYVGEDKARAAEALAAEQAKGDSARSTLVEKLEKLAS